MITEHGCFCHTGHIGQIIWPAFSIIRAFFILTAKFLRELPWSRFLNVSRLWYKHLFLIQDVGRKTQIYSIFLKRHKTTLQKKQILDILLFNFLAKNGSTNAKRTEITEHKFCFMHTITEK